ncbi:MAG TPA: carbohydrate ABC transporter permease [Humibacter sp.]|nr:carbohydrate ABC transporter permease [Humibacter sp.]
MTTSTIEATRGARRGSGSRERAAHGRPRRNVIAHLFLAIMVVYFLVPIWWLFVASTKNAQGLFSGSGALWFGKDFDLLANLHDLFTYNGGEYLQWLGNSVLYAVSGGVGATVIAVLAGYGFAKYQFRGRNFTFALLLGSVMVPLTALVIPTFVLLSNLHLTDTIWAIILPSLLSPFGVYLMRVYTADAVPDELLDAARVDGAGEYRTFFTVALPLMRPALITVLLLSVVGTWNNYFLPLAMLSTSKLYPITVGLGLWSQLASSNNGGGHSLWSLIIVGALVSIIPLIIAFLTLQKYWQGGLSLGSLK